MRKHLPLARLWSVTLILVLLGAIVPCRKEAASDASAGDPEARLFWSLERALAQGRQDVARQLSLKDPALSLRLLHGLLLVQLELALDLEDAAPLSPNMGKVISLLLDVVADEATKRVAQRLSALSPDTNPFSNEPSELAALMAAFITAARTEEEESGSAWRSVLHHCETMRLSLGKIVALHHLAQAEREKGNFAAAIAYLNQVQALLSDWNYPARLSAVLNAFGIVAFRLGLLETAHQTFLSALSFAKEVGDAQQMGKVLTNLSAVALLQGDYPRAHEYLQQALTHGRTLARLINLGMLYGRLRDYESALRVYYEAQELAGKDQDLRRQITLWTNLGEIYRLQGNYEQATYCLHRALEISEKVQDVSRLLPIHFALGSVYREQGNFERAAEHFTELLRLSQRMGSQLWTARALVEMGVLLERQKRLDEALQSLEEGLRVAEQINHQPTCALALMNLGVVWEKKGELERALQAYQQALTAWEQAGDRWMGAWCWDNIGETYEKLAAKLSGKEREKVILRATDAYWRAVRLMEQVRLTAGRETMQVMFAQTSSAPFYRLAALLARQRRYEEAFEVTERMRAQALLELLQQTPLLRWRQPVDPEYQKWQRRIAEVERELLRELSASSFQPTDRSYELRQRLTALRNEFEQWRHWRQVQQWQLVPVREKQLTAGAWRRFVVPHDTAVLSYLVTEKQTWVFILSQRGKGMQVIGVPLGFTRQELEEDIRWLQGQMGRRKPVGATLLRLYTRLIVPIKPFLRNKRRLVIVPDSLLYALPFQALQDFDNRYLVEQFSIAYAPSVTALEALNQRAKKERKVASNLLWVGFGAPKLDASLAPLPYARQEVSAIAKMLRRSGKFASVQAFLGPTASEEAAKKALQQGTWVHFATHGIADPQRPLYSRLFLTPSKNQDGILNVHEVLDLGLLPARKVVLSACETGLGRSFQGEGLLGMVWSFLAVGTQTLVVSQWQVDDLSTAKLMVAYYRHLLRGKAPADALAAAQREFVEHPRFSHPYFWAGFVLWGSGWSP